MPFMSRFRKGGKEEEEDQEDAELIGDIEEEGLLVATGSARAQPAAEKTPDPADELVAAAEPATVGEAEAQAGPEAAGPDTPAAAPDALAAPDPAAEAEPEKVEGEEAPAKQDDALALFRGSETAAKASSLSSEVEDVPAEDLVAQLREIRQLLKLPDRGAETEAG